MATLANITHRIARSPGDPRLLQKGPRSMAPSDRLARALGWFSFGLGVAELLAPRRIADALGLDGKEKLIRAYGLREIAAGIPTLSFDKQVGLASRIAGDALDLATLAPALSRSNPKRKNAMIATAAVGTVTLLDIAAAASSFSRQRSAKAEARDFSDRSGLPMGIESSRGLARQDFHQPADMRAEPANTPSKRRTPGKAVGVDPPGGGAPSDNEREIRNAE